MTEIVLHWRLVWLPFVFRIEVGTLDGDPALFLVWRGYYCALFRRRDR